MPTPTGTYYTPARYRWLKMVGDTWAQWCTQIEGNYLFHSVPNMSLIHISGKGYHKRNDTGLGLPAL